MIPQTNKLNGWALCIGGILIGLGLPADAQSAAPAPAPTSYTFTWPAESVDAIYNAIERASQMQSLVTGDRSPRLDAIQAQIRQSVQEQKLAAEKAPKVAEEPKKEAPKP